MLKQRVKGILGLGCGGGLLGLNRANPLDLLCKFSLEFSRRQANLKQPYTLKSDGGGQLAPRFFHASSNRLADTGQAVLICWANRETRNSSSSQRNSSCPG
jgi:hypothetical protein